MEKFFKTTYNSPVGVLTLVASEQGLVECNFEKVGRQQNVEVVESRSDNVILKEAINWLDLYFAGKQPSINGLRLTPQGTVFQRDVWECLKEIAYGQTTTYGEIAKKLAVKYGKQKMSAQAVGQAVGKNPVGIIVPCHRVIGANGKLVGYAGGLDKKIALLKHEGHNIDLNKKQLL